jgi:hypothetical protein
MSYYIVKVCPEDSFYLHGHFLLPRKVLFFGIIKVYRKAFGPEGIPGFLNLRSQLFYTGFMIFKLVIENQISPIYLIFFLILLQITSISFPGSLKIYFSENGDACDNDDKES